MKDFDRMLRVNEVLQRELGQLVEKYVAPEISQGIVTITKVKTAPDLRNATVGVSVFGADKETVFRTVKRKRKVLQEGIARNVKLKYTPKLEFRLDETAEQADHVLSILDELEIPDDK